MKLTVVDATPQDPWYSGGLRFACTQCGNCCTGKPGYVWIEEPEIARLAQLLSLTIEQTIEQYCRRVGSRYSLKENFNRHHGGYDCIFLKELPAEKTPGVVTHSRRVCSIYNARPVQCRSWPFWESNLATPKSWELASRGCPGMGQGKLHSLKKIEAARDQTSAISR